MSNGLRPEEIGAYVFGDVTAAPDFDPDSQGRADLLPGTHRFRVCGWGQGEKAKPAYELYPSQSAKWDGQAYTINKLLVRFRCVDGPCRGAITTDFVPIPGAGCPLPVAGFQNQCAHFFKALGFDLPPGQYVPAGLRLQDIEGRECMIKIEQQRDASRQPKFNDDGTPAMAPAFFGYARVGSVPASTAPARPAQTPPARPTNGSAAAACQQPAAPVAAAVADFDV
jgi:hypothetical protein